MEKTCSFPSSCKDVQTHLPAILISLLGWLVFFVIMLSQHRYFGTSGWDLGIFMQTTFQYAHGSVGPNTVRNVPNLLGDHFEPILFLISPLWWIFRDNTLFFVQSLALVVGGLGVYTAVYSRPHKLRKAYAIGALCLFLVHWSLLQAITFDYHNNVLGMAFLPWVIVFLQRKQWLWVWVFAVLLIATKETAALMVLTLGIGTIFTKCRKSQIHGILLAIFGILYFWASTKIFIPFFAGGEYHHLTYDRLGQSLGEILLFILQHPIQTVFMFFDHPEKLQFWKYFLFSGGFFLLRWPRLLLIALPIIAMKLLSSKANHWGIWYHYNVEFAVLISISAGWTCMLLTKRMATIVLTLLLGINILITARMPLSDRITPAYKHIVQNFTSPLPWHNAAREALQMIPSFASVSAQNLLIPHLADRAGIYLFPEYDKAEYVLVHTETYNVWPLATQEDMQKAIKILESEQKFSLIFEKYHILLYKNSHYAP